MTIVLRRDIGTALTYDQLDDNFVDYKIFRDKFAQTQWTGDNNGKLLYFNNATGKIELKSLSATDLAGGFSTNFASSFATRTTDDLSEGSTNLYYTSARANSDFDIRLATRSTTNLVEGSRLYYTNDRVDARIVNAGSNNWNTAYGWGNHASAGYLTDITAQTIGSLSNVDTTGAVNGKILKYNGTNWVVADDASGAASITLSDLSVGPNALASGSGGISYDNTTGVFTYTPPDLSGATFDGQWSSLTGTPTTIAGYGITDAFNGDYNALSNTPDLSNYLTNLNSESINTLSNVNASDAVNGQVLKYNASTGNWEAENDAGMTAVALTDISDVTITLPTTGQVLKYNGASWVNDTDSGGIALSDLSVTVLSASGNGNLSYDNTTGVFTFTPADTSGGGSSYDQSLNTTDSVEFAGVTTSNFTVNGSGTVNFSATDLTFTASNRAKVNGAPFRLARMTTTERDAIASPEGGDMIFNTTTNNFEKYNGTTWIADSSLTDTDALAEGSTNLYYTNARVDAHLNQSNPTSGYVLSWNGSDYAWVAQSAGSGGISNVVEDTSPQLGGTLDLNSNNITTSADSFEVTTSSGSNLTTIGFGRTSDTGYTGEGLAIASSTNNGQDVVLLGDINFTSGLISGELIGMWAYDNATTISSINGLAGLTLNGVTATAGVTIVDAPIGFFGNSGTSNEVGLAIGTSADARIHVLNSSGNTIYKFPATDGTANQVLTTDGNGDLSFATISGIATTVNKVNNKSNVTGLQTLDFSTKTHHFINANGNTQIRGSNWQPGVTYSILLINTSAGSIDIELQTDTGNVFDTITVPAGQGINAKIDSYGTSSDAISITTEVVVISPYWNDSTI